MSSLSPSAQTRNSLLAVLGTKSENGTRIIEAEDGPRIVEFVSDDSFMIHRPDGRKACRFSISIYGEGVTVLPRHEEDLFPATGVQIRSGDRCVLEQNCTGQSPHEEVARQVVREMKIDDGATDALENHSSWIPGIRCPDPSCGTLIGAVGYPCPNCDYQAEA